MICEPPTVPNWIVLPFTVPLMVEVLPPGLRWMMPFSFEPFWCHASLNVPEKAPLYVPDQVPESPESDDPPVGEEVAGGELAGDAAGDWEPVVGLEPLHATAATDSSDRAAINRTLDAARFLGCSIRSTRILPPFDPAL